jgi:hypothetical protein
MIVESKKYSLSVKNYIPIESKKSLIVIGNTLNCEMKHVIGWLHRLNGEYKKTAAFTISSDGIVYKHFEPKYFSRFFKNNNELNNRSIVILLENLGPLIKDVDKNVFLTWTDDIYNEINDVFDKKWRGYNFWTPYTDKQIASLIELVQVLCDRFDIPLKAIGHNTKVTNISDFNGVIYKSNLEKHYIDPNPNLDYELIKNKIENYERKY